MMMDSIESMKRNFEFNKIFVASDSRDPINNKVDSIEYIEKNSSTEKLYGLKNIAEMYRIFEIASEGADYVQKTDSDMLCCSDYAYNRLQSGLWDAYGGFPMATPKMIPERHFSGGVYFLSTNVCKKLTSSSFDERIVRDWSWMNFPEDMVTSSMVSKITKNVMVDGAAHHEDGRFFFDIWKSKTLEKGVDKARNFGYAHCRTSPRILNYLLKEIYGTGNG